MTTPRHPVRTLLVDDQHLFREAIRTVLELDDRFLVVGECGDGQEAVTLAAQLKPDVVLLDLRLPGISGIEVIRRIHAEPDGARVLALTTFDEDHEVLAALRHGASGYALKTLPAAELKAALLTVAQGGAYLQPCVTGHVVEEFRRLSRVHGAQTDEGRLMDQLSGRELDILRHLVRGRSNKEIASELGVTEGTVKNHLTSIFAKFRAPDRTTVALKARDLGIR